MKDVLVFTDLGTNPDDLLALAMLSRLENVRIRCIISSADPTGQRARLIKDLVPILGLKGTAVVRGAEKPMSEAGYFRWLGYEDELVENTDEISRVKDVLPLLLQPLDSYVILSLSPLTDSILPKKAIRKCRGSLPNSF